MLNSISRRTAFIFIAAASAAVWAAGTVTAINVATWLL